MVKLELDMWLRPEDVVKDTELFFVDSGQHSEIPVGEDKEPVESFEIGVVLPNGEKKIWTMNKTSQRAVAQTYGVDTEAWVNKKVVVFTQDQNVRGVMKKVIYARVPSEIPVAGQH